MPLFDATALNAIIVVSFRYINERTIVRAQRYIAYDTAEVALLTLSSSNQYLRAK